MEQTLWFAERQTTDLSQSEQWQKAQRGELYLAFVPELVAARDRCLNACLRFNSTTNTVRRNLVALWRDVIGDTRPLPPLAPSQAEDDALFDSDPWILPPLHADYGHNIKLGSGVFINFNATFVDTCPVTIGARCLVGPNCSFYTGSHPLDPALRNGTSGPELGKPIDIGEDSWLGGNVTILPGVTIGRGCTVGAGSVVTKDVPAFHVVAGNPARILRKIETAMDPTTATSAVPANSEVAEGSEVVMAQAAP